MRLRSSVVPLLVVALARAGGWFLRGILSATTNPPHSGDGEPEAEVTETSVEVVTTLVTEGRLAVTTAAFGVVRAADGEIAVVSSRAGSRVAAILSRTGDDVGKGAPILRLETAPLDLALTQARSAALTAENQLAEFDRTGRARRLADLASATEQAKADVALATAQVARLEKLRGDGLSSEKARAEADRAVGAAQRDLDVAVRALEGYRDAEADLQRSTLVSARDAALANVKDAEAILLDAEVLAPAPGRVLAFSVRPGDRVEAGAELATLLTGDRRVIAFGVLAGQASTIGDGAPVTWTDRVGIAREAHVRAVIPRVESGLGLVEVLAVPDDAAPAPYPGEIVRGDIEARRLPKAILVPNRSIVRSEDATTLVVVKGDVSRRVIVRVLAQHDGVSAVEGEVAVGDRVVVEGAYNLPDGARVRERAEAPTDGGPR